MATLAEKLNELGYAFVMNKRFASADLRLELAIREFQTYAKLKWAAREVDKSKPYYAKRLESVELPDEHRLLTEGVTGAQTERTKALIDIWVDKKYRCPVVVECWRSKRTRLNDKTRWWTRIGDPPVGENIWLWDDPKQFNATKKGRRMFVRDFTKRFDEHPVYKRLVEDPKWPRLLIGRQNDEPDKKPAQDGPVNDKKSEQVACEVTAMALTGKAYADLEDKAKITYRVVRAVSEAECDGYFDTINCWDKALVSIGLCHWTIAHPDKDDNGNEFLVPGELEALLAYAKKLDPSILKDVVGDSGVEPSKPWYNGDKGILNTRLRKYEAQFSQINLVTQNGNLVEKLEPIPFDRNRYNFLRSWHWVYRFEMACRTSAKLQHVMWDMARFRLRDIGTTLLGIDGVKNGAGNPATLGDVFTSEQTIAWLMEWHVLAPGDVFTGGKPTETIKKVVKTSGVTLSNPTNKWDDEDEIKLLKSLEKHKPKEKWKPIKERFERAMSCRQLSDCPHPDKGIANPTALSAARNSFKLDDSNLGLSPF